MTAALRALLLLTVAAASAHLASAQQARETVTITEPGVYELADLFKQADTVALVKVVSGETDTYNVAVYKAEVVKAFKGSATGETLYFGPYVGTRLGWEYILFLRHPLSPLTRRTPSSTGYGDIHYLEAFNEGYTSLETSYGCVFDGKDVEQKCDYGVRTCTDYIRLPKSMPTFPPRTEDPPFGCRWVRKSAFVSLLDSLAGQRK
jgi:hypothetical protein